MPYFRKKSIYLDYAATSPVDKRIIEAMKPFYEEYFGNPSSVHSYGQKSLIAIDKAREQIAQYLGCKTHEIIFTSGATEANNIAILGYLQKIIASSVPHVITSSIEHEAVLEPIRHLERQNKIKVDYIAPDTNGLISVSDVEKLISENTRLISIMYANNETGVIQPIRDIGKLVKKLNKNRQQPIRLHTDAVQAIQYCNSHVDHVKVDLLSISGHKINAPKGIGMLYVRDGLELQPIMYGGKQQKGIRPGTIPTPLIVGLAQAFELLRVYSIDKRSQDVYKLRDYFFDSLKSELPQIETNVSLEKTLPSHLNIYIPSCDNTTLMTALDMAGVAVSAGAACASGALEPSHVLKAQGFTQERIQKSLRITLSPLTTVQEIKRATKIITEQVKNLS